MNTTMSITPIETWLVSLGLEAVEVDRCPVAECTVCGPPTSVIAA
ncbi:MAG TPA: hypothetical protein VJP05_04625 [Acidimicrobiia bacterium]|nr:hypothetical protein [Acidimicrobiia bacterium]